MRVLWFTTTPSHGAIFLNHQDIGCSWIESLESSLTKRDNIELGIAFLWSGKNIQPYKIDKTRYYPLPRKTVRGKLKKFYSRWSHKIATKENVPEYVKVVREFAPDIIHIFGTENDYGMMIPEINVPCIIHIQGSLIMCDHKWYSGLTKSEVFLYSKKWQLLKGHGLFHSYFTFKKAADRERTIFKNARHFAGRTDWDRRLTATLSPTANYFHCDEMMRPTFYLRQWFRQSSQKQYTIISVIRNVIYKGLETVYECKKMLGDLFPGMNIVWKIGGINEQDEIAYLVRRKYADAWERQGIQLLGALQESELVNEMLNADVFVHPSHIENSSNGLCEAMLLGMPAIATYAGGTPSLLADKKEGILVQDGDPYALTGAIAELIREGDYANSLGANARKRAIARHDPERIVNDVMNIYSSVISKKSQ
jgi:glycosyltransferase involved in cell wall biosynthesis